ncbi:unnamed protein product [Dimorphilus gyrociliatus]|uniref:Profilin n=1 Tax=Dimorphilus gyrociliatus TaxID=2664684 RepID=A0A7I8VCL8_9ANNE|nr:unnamed protein product [Dimorphilus gyrociliatus]
MATGTMLDYEMSKKDHLQKKGVPDKVKLNQLQNLLHDALLATGHVSRGALIKQKDCSLKASTVGFSIPFDQMQLICDAFSNLNTTREQGVLFEGRLYKCVRADKNSIYGKHGKRGIVLVKTQTLIVVGVYSENMYPSVCIESVEKLGDYLKEKGK